jgi:hypothetical protein
MTDPRQTNDLLDAIAGVLLRCVCLGFGLLIIWAAVYFAAGDLLFRLNGPLFGLTQHEVNLMHFYGIVFVKCLVLIFFLIPYIAIRLVLQKRHA